MRQLKLSAIFLIIVAVLFSNALFTSCNRNPQKVRIGYLPITLSLPFFTAMEKGYFTQAGLEIEAIPYTTADQLTNALVAGNIDLTANTSTSTFMSTIEQSPGFGQIYMVSYHTLENYLDALLVKKGSAIKRIEDLKGKKIGIFPGSTNVINLSIALSHYMDPNTDIEIQQIAPETHINALASGQVDAIYTLEPLATAAIASGVGELLQEGLNARYIVNPFPGGAYIVSTKFYTNNNDAARKAINAMYQGVDFIRSNEPEARSYFEKYTPIKGPITQKTHIGAWWKLDEVQKDKVQKLLDVLYESKQIKTQLNGDNYYLR